MGNAFYNRGASFNPDELADGDAIEAEFDSVSRGFDTIENLVNVNKAGYPTQTFHVAPATEPTHAVQKDQLADGLGLKLDADNYNATDILTKIKTVDGSGSGLDADLLDGQDGAYYRNASNINAGTIGDAYLPTTISSSITGNASTATTLQTARTINGVSFNGSANIIAEPYVETDSTAATRYVTFVDSGTAGYQRLNIDGRLTYNTSTNLLAASISGNAATATTLQNARTINSVSFNGGANITVEPYVELDTGTEATRYLTFVDSSTAGYQRMNMDTALNYNPSTNVLGATISGNAATATKLQTARTITLGGDLSGYATFDGSANITISGSVNNISALHGTITNGGTIPLPSGYTEAQCKWIVSINDSNANGTGWDVREGLSTNHYETRCYTTGRVVTATMYAYNDTTDTGVTYAASANYIIIGVK